MGGPKLCAEANTPLNASKTINTISYKLWVSFTYKKGGCEHESGTSNTFFELTPSIASKSALLANGPNNVFLVNAGIIQVIIILQLPGTEHEL